ncbi:MAG: flagellar export protein FliJ [Oscillospiraceae bacterium]|nr:flagellar export protein FliJ [Oscillospiraceae bacterium]
MKRFKFSLDKLKGYKEQILDKEKNDLAQLRSQQQALVEEKRQVEETLRLSNEEFIKKSGSGMNVIQITMFKSYHQSLSQQIKELEESIEKMENRVQRQLKVVIEATKEVSSLEKLEEKQLEAYNFQVAKAEEQFISEYVINSTYK